MSGSAYDGSMAGHDATKIDIANMDNGVPMTALSTMVPTSAATTTAIAAVLAIANSKTAVHFWDAGSWKNGAPNTGDIVIFTDTGSVASGNAVFNLTDDYTSTGVAICSSILQNSLNGVFIDSSGNYNKGNPTVAGNMKTVTMPSTKQTAGGVVVLTLTVVGTITYPAAPNATVTNLFGIGIAA